VVAEKEIRAVVVICPKCKVRLKVADEKIAPEGTRFKCPKCGTVLLVKRPVPRVRPLDGDTVLVAHEEPSVMERLRAVLSARGYKVIPVTDGIAAMVNATRELPFLAVLGVSIPKIYGFEVCRRLKSRPETRDMKIILIASVYDENKYRRHPQSLHGADDYIEEYQIEGMLIGKIEALKAAGKPSDVPSRDTGKIPEAAAGATTEQGKTAVAEVALQPPLATPHAVQNLEGVEKARRLARTIVSDIYLYSKAKVDDSIRNDAFHKVFASELKEGLKLYEARVPAEVKRLGDFFSEAVNNFIDKRKKELA
jgi:predicted Zn finger-like uncharacterized protein